jgi:vancomycin permeability regulator SanA
VKKETKKILLPSLFFIVQLVALFSLKYFNQNLSLSEFKIGFIGNVFLLLIYLMIISGLFINSIIGGKKISNKYIFSFIIISWLLLFLAFLSTKIDFGLAKIYLFGQPGNKLLSGLLYSFFLIGLFAILFHIWISSISKSKAAFIKSIFSSILMLLIFLILTFIYTTSFGYAAGNWKLNRNSNNMAVVLGAAVWSGNLPSPTLSGRVDKALELVNNGFAGKILVTGSSAPGELTEAEVALNYLLAKGIDTSIVSIETTTTSTTEQIQFIRNNLIASPNLADIIVISDPYHLPRVIEISKFFNLNIKVAESRHLINFNDKLYNNIRESIAIFIFWCFAL